MQEKVYKLIEQKKGHFVCLCYSCSGRKSLKRYYLNPRNHTPAGFVENYTLAGKKKQLE